MGTVNQVIGLTTSTQISDILLGIGIYASWLALVLFGDSLPIIVLFLLGGYIGCLHGGYQHIAVHGYPTRIEWLNSLLVYPPLILYFPYPTYRNTHLIHHECDVLTDVATDPESVYLSQAHWNSLNRLSQFIYKINFTLAGRMLIGPFISLYHLWKSESKLILAGNFERPRIWLIHIVLCAAILVFVNVAGMPIWKYLLCVAYPGISLTLLRSYTEHRWSPEAKERSLIVEGSIISRLLYLNNNFHWIHHEKPGLHWTAIPKVYRQRKAEILKANGNYFYKGYTDIFKRLWHDKLISPVHPLENH